MRLIDADAMYKTYQEICSGIACISCPFLNEDGCEVEQMIRYAPTIEAEPVKRGKWFYDEIADEYLVYRCSACNIPSTLDTPYCPWCGARMSEGSEE